uniref:Ground-like domain-containing protein n=1 Tax=Heterorhabditis bacteriophora TaxID=37862 RepID=A0A1I7XMQ0_HETBA
MMVQMNCIIDNNKGMKRGRRGALFFGGGSSDCGCPPPPCPPPPACAPPPLPVCPPTPICGPPAYAPYPIYSEPPAPLPQSYASPVPPPQAQPIDLSYSAPVSSYIGPAQAVKSEVVETKLYEQASFNRGNLRSRVKREAETTFDPKCNSDVLKNIILKNIHESTAVSKRQIQKAATDEIGGRVDVICSSGTFSYIVNTELYCETEKNGTTCFAFRQSS